MKRRVLKVCAGFAGAALLYSIMADGSAPDSSKVAVNPAAIDDEESVDRPPSSLPYKQAVRPLVARYCLDCHRRDLPSGGIVLEEPVGAELAGADLLLWRKAYQAMRSGIMPPAGEVRPSLEDRNAFKAWLIDAEFRKFGTGSIEPGRVPLRRLNRAEYNNTIRDLAGLDIKPADDFPADDVGYGFDNIGDVLAISPLLSERYVEAAEKIVDCLFASEDARHRLMNPPTNDSLPYGARGLLPVRDNAGKSLRVSRGDFAPPDPMLQELDRAGNILRSFADRAYRRPIRYDELARLLRFVENSQKEDRGIEPGIRLALQAILASPHFLFRLEGLVPASDSATRPNDDFELASRLSYFLWSSLPDDRLYQLASIGKLREPRILIAEARRLLQDPRSRALVDNFFAQWLQLRNLSEFNPDPALFPDFDEALRTAMRCETELFCNHIIQKDRDIREFLDADYTFVNERLARHYGMGGIQGDEFRQVSLSGTNRGGLLTHAGILAVTSNPTRTSPVKRGRWILENLLAAPIPSPPPGVDDLARAKSHQGTLRQRLEQHRTNVQCASCHQLMDPLGFGLENFDAIGAWRSQEANRTIDASGTIDGISFSGPAELRKLLHARSDEFTHCLSEKLLTYALGRGLVPSDQCAIDSIVRRLDRNQNRFSSLIVGIVLSEPFRTRTPLRTSK